MVQPIAKTYVITPKDIAEYNDSLNSKLHDLWWEILHSLPLHLFREALAKGFLIKDKDGIPADGPKYMELYVPNSTHELADRINALDLKIIFESK